MLQLDREFSSLTIPRSLVTILIFIARRFIKMFYSNLWNASFFYFLFWKWPRIELNWKKNFHSSRCIQFYSICFQCNEVNDPLSLNFLCVSVCVDLCLSICKYWVYTHTLNFSFVYLLNRYFFFLKSSMIKIAWRA